MLTAEISDRLMGIECECLIPVIGRGDNMDVQTLLAQVLTNQGVQAVARGYSKAPLPQGCMVAVEHDSSLRDTTPYRGLSVSKIEIKTMPATYRYLAEWFPAVLDVVLFFGGRVNESCGTHIHTDCREIVQQPEIARNLSHLFWRFHCPLAGCVAESRRHNQYCRLPQQSEATRFDRVRSYQQLCEKLRHCSRYEALNFTNLSDSQRLTIENRQHHGTLSWPKIAAWALLNQRLVEHSIQRSCHYRPEALPNTQGSLRALATVIGLRPNTRIYRKVNLELRQVGKYLMRRWKHFNTPHDPKNHGDAKATVLAA